MHKSGSDIRRVPSHDAYPESVKLRWLPVTTDRSAMTASGQCFAVDLIIGEPLCPGSLVRADQPQVSAIQMESFAVVVCRSDQAKAKVATLADLAEAAYERFKVRAQIGESIRIELMFRHQRDDVLGKLARRCFAPNVGQI